MKLYEILDECKEIKEYLQNLVGNEQAIDMGIRFKNMQVTYILPEIFEKKIDDVAKKFLNKRDGHYYLIGKGQNSIEEIENTLTEIKKEFIKKEVKENSKNMKKRNK